MDSGSHPCGKIFMTFVVSVFLAPKLAHCAATTASHDSKQRSDSLANNVYENMSEMISSEGAVKVQNRAVLNLIEAHMRDAEKTCPNQCTLGNITLSLDKDKVFVVQYAPRLMRGFGFFAPFLQDLLQEQLWD